MKTLRSRCIYKRSDSFKVILNQFFYGEKQLVPDDIMNAIRNEIHNRGNMLSVDPFSNLYFCCFS